MKIKYLGTGASEGIPALGCQCDICKNARIVKQKEIRGRSQTLINDDLLIDFNADTFRNFTNYDLDFNNVNNLLITHSHQDHLYASGLDTVANHFIKGYKGLNIFVGKNGLKEIKKSTNRKRLKDDVNMVLVKPYRNYKVGNYDVFSLKASHDEKTSPFIYLIFDGNKRILYAHDTGMLTNEVFDYLARQGRIDLLSIDCTYGIGKSNQIRHLGINEDVLVVNKLKELNVIDSNTKIVLNHITHNATTTYEDLKKEADKYGFIASYDGLEIEI